MTKSCVSPALSNLKPLKLPNLNICEYLELVFGYVHSLYAMNHQGLGLWGRSQGNLN